MFGASEARAEDFPKGGHRIGWYRVSQKCHRAARELKGGLNAPQGGPKKSHLLKIKSKSYLAMKQRGRYF